MTARQSAHLMMFKGVIHTCDAHQSAWSAFAPFADTYAEFKTVHAGLLNLISAQQSNIIGYTMNKKAYREELSHELLLIVQMLVLYSQLHNAPQVASDARTSRSGLNQLPATGLIGFGTRILQLASGLDPLLLAPIGLSSAVLQSAQDKLQDFTAQIDAPKNQLQQRVAATRELAGTIEALILILNRRLDPAANVLRISQPQFHSQYKIARRIIDPGFRKRAMIVRITDSVTGAKIAGVSAIITPGNIRKQTGAGGSFYINRLEEGTYTVKLEHESYEGKELIFYVVARTKGLLEVALVAKEVA
jgi:hypothetical protein